MKSKVIIENGRTQIVLTPENDFDTDVITKLYKRKKEFEIKTEVTAKKASYHSWSSDGMEDYRLVLTIDPAKDVPKDTGNYSLPLAE